MLRAGLVGILIGYSFSQVIIDVVTRQTLTPIVTLITLVAILYYVSATKDIRL